MISQSGLFFFFVIIFLIQVVFVMAANDILVWESQHLTDDGRWLSDSPIESLHHIALPEGVVWKGDWKVIPTAAADGYGWLMGEEGDQRRRQWARSYIKKPKDFIGSPQALSSYAERRKKAAQITRSLSPPFSFGDNTNRGSVRTIPIGRDQTSPVMSFHKSNVPEYYPDVSVRSISQPKSFDNHDHISNSSPAMTLDTKEPLAYHPPHNSLGYNSKPNRQSQSVRSVSPAVSFDNTATASNVPSERRLSIHRSEGNSDKSISPTRVRNNLNHHMSSFDKHERNSFTPPPKQSYRQPVVDSRSPTGNRSVSPIVSFEKSPAISTRQPSHRSESPSDGSTSPTGYQNNRIDESKYHHHHHHHNPPEDPELVGTLLTEIQDLKGKLKLLETRDRQMCERLRRSTASPTKAIIIRTRSPAPAPVQEDVDRENSGIDFSSRYSISSLSRYDNMSKSSKVSISVPNYDEDEDEDDDSDSYSYSYSDDDEVRSRRRSSRSDRSSRSSSPTRQRRSSRSIPRDFQSESGRSSRAPIINYTKQSIPYYKQPPSNPIPSPTRSALKSPVSFSLNQVCLLCVIIVVVDVIFFIK